MTWPPAGLAVRLHREDGLSILEIDPGVLQAQIRAWLARRPRFHVHLTPTGSSWMNQVELDQDRRRDERRHPMRSHVIGIRTRGLPGSGDGGSQRTVAGEQRRS
jgi:hypothetical protein